MDVHSRLLQVIDFMWIEVIKLSNLWMRGNCLKDSWYFVLYKYI